MMKDRVGNTIFPRPISSTSNVFFPGADDWGIMALSLPTFCPVRSNFMTDGDKLGADTPAERGTTDCGIMGAAFSTGCSANEGRTGVCEMTNRGGALEVGWCDNWGVSEDCDKWGLCEVVWRCGGRDGGRTRVTGQRFVDDRLTASNKHIDKQSFSLRRVRRSFINLSITTY